MEPCLSIFNSKDSFTRVDYGVSPTPNPSATYDCFIRKRDETVHPLGKMLLDLEPMASSADQAHKSGDLNDLRKLREERQRHNLVLQELLKILLDT